MLGDQRPRQTPRLYSQHRNSKWWEPARTVQLLRIHERNGTNALRGQNQSTGRRKQVSQKINRGALMLIPVQMT